MTGADTILKEDILLGERVGRGGEATVWALRGTSHSLAKIYHQPTAERANKLEVMLQHPPDVISNGQTVIAWPTARVFSHTDKSKVIGFLMPKVSGVQACHLHNMKSRLRINPHFHWRYLVRAARNLAVAVAKVHEAGYVIGDLNDQGVLIGTDAQVSLVDCDSFQVRDPHRGKIYRSTVGVGLFTPPELARCDFSRTDRSPNHDLFGMSVIIYQLLMGSHPFQVKVAKHQEAIGIEDAIRRGLYPDLVTSVEPSPVAPPCGIIPDDVRAAFRTAFRADAGTRPDARTWDHLLWELERTLRVCAQNSHHAFAPHLSGCPWCVRAVFLGGRDAFPSSKVIAKGDHLKPSVRRAAVHTLLNRPSPAAVVVQTVAVATAATPPLRQPSVLSPARRQPAPSVRRYSGRVPMWIVTVVGALSIWAFAFGERQLAFATFGLGLYVLWELRPRISPAPITGIYVVASWRGHKYHRETCDWARRIRRHNRRTFKTAFEASRLGLMPCGVCRP